MTRFMVCAAFLYAGTVALAQSGANPTPAPDPVFGSGGYQVAPLATIVPFGPAHSCSGLSADQSQIDTPANLDHIFHIPCLDLKSHPVLLAHNEIPFVQPQRLWPNAKAEPIPTQWPKVRMELIPTQWPNLKMQPLAGPAKTTP